MRILGEEKDVAAEIIKIDGSSTGAESASACAAGTPLCTPPLATTIRTNPSLARSCLNREHGKVLGCEGLSMKRVRVAPGKFVAVPNDVA